MALVARARTPSELRPIHDARAHSAALREIERLWSSSRPEELERLELLSILVEAYERERLPMPAPTPIAAIEFRMEQLGLSRADLGRILGSRSRATEILEGRRALSLQMVRRLHEALAIPAETLLQPLQAVGRRPARPSRPAGRPVRPPKETRRPRAAEPRRLPRER